MNSYYYPIKTAAWHFLIVAFLFTIPYMIYNYRKYGSVSILRSFIIYTFIYYLLSALYLVILPLPAPSALSGTRMDFVQLVPFKFITEFITKVPLDIKSLIGIKTIIASHQFIQPVFNIILTIPFGIYLRYYFKTDLKKTILFSFLLSVIFEVTQLTGIYGIYKLPYRVFDVDDLFLNTLGGLIGFYIAGLAIKILPSKKNIDEKSIEKGQVVSFTRRLIAFMFDIVFANIIAALISFIIGIKYYAILIFLYFIIFSIFLKGRTFGKMIVKIRTSKNQEGRIPLPILIVVKYASVYLIYEILTYLIFKLDTRLLISSRAGTILILLIELGVILLFIIDAIYGYFHNKRLWYERISNTKNESYTKKEH